MTAPITIYSLGACPACDEAKEYLKKNSIRFNYVDLGKDPSKIQGKLDSGEKIEIPIICSTKNPDKCVNGFSEEVIDELLE